MVHPIKRHSIKIAIILLGIGCILWIGTWFFAVAQYHRVIDGWIATQRAAGYDVSYDSKMTAGFPHHIMLRFDNLRWKNNDNILFRADHMDLSSRPWDWQHFRAKFKGHVELDAPLEGDAGAMILGGEEGRANVELDDDGFWKSSRVVLDHARIGVAPNNIFTADSLKASALRPDQAPKDHTETGLTLSGEAENMSLPPSMPSPFGRTIKQTTVNLRVMDKVPDFRKKESMEIWNNDSGVVEFDNLHMEWGPMNITAKGTVGFDDALQPEGAFASSISGHKEVLKALMDYGFIAQRQKAMMDSALDLFAKPSEGSTSSAIDIPITVQLSGLFFGPLKIFSFPEIAWTPQPMPTAQRSDPTPTP